MPSTEFVTKWPKICIPPADSGFFKGRRIPHGAPNRPTESARRADPHGRIGNLYFRFNRYMRARSADFKRQIPPDRFGLAGLSPIPRTQGLRGRRRSAILVWRQPLSRTNLGTVNLTESSLAPSLASPESRRVQLPIDLALRLGSNLDQMKVLPAVAMQALEIARDVDSSITRFSAVVERDAKLATDILRMSNSVVFSGGQQITSLHQAISRLGFRHCKNLIMSSCVGSLMRRLSLAESLVRERLYRHGFLTALLASNINHCLALKFTGEEFTAGLIHDIGRALIAMCLPESFTAHDRLDFVETEQILTGEQAAWGADHCAVGAWFAQQNHLPESLVDVIRFHHHPEQSSDHRLLVTLIAASDEIANHLQEARRVAFLPLSKFPSLGQLEALGIENAVERFAAQAVNIANLALADVTNLNRKS